MPVAPATLRADWALVGATAQVADAVIVPEDAPPGQSVSPGGARVRNAPLSRALFPDASRWTNPAEAQRQAQALRGEVTRHQVPDQDAVAAPRLAAVLHLAAVDAVTHGAVRYEQASDRDNLGYWDDPTAWVEWPVQIVAPGRFRVTAEVTASGSGLFTVAAGGRSVTGHAPDTSNFSGFQSIDAGTLTITQTGRVWISVHPVADGWKWMNLKSLTLTPVP